MLLKSQGQNRLPKRRSSEMAIYTFNAPTLASETCIEGLMMQARKINAIGLAETRRYRSLYAVFETGEELFLGKCDSRGVGGVGVLINVHSAMNIDSYESLTTRIGRLRLIRCGLTPTLTIFVAYAPTSSYQDEELELEFIWIWRGSIEKITLSLRSSSVILTARLAPKERLKSSTSGLTEWNGMSRVKGYRRAVWKRHMNQLIPRVSPEAVPELSNALDMPLELSLDTPTVTSPTSVPLLLQRQRLQQDHHSRRRLPPDIVDLSAFDVLPISSRLTRTPSRTADVNLRGEVLEQAECTISSS
ncbi:unnamed protein product [Haemonchus placei]|uniref:Tub domain-containing protein n=1 Tax=Haemonchus placei TaxID=6290 RepID=A0A158QK69_HAEPC|nr:unnamed protein product [Haemonchus placei]